MRVFGVRYEDFLQFEYESEIQDKASIQPAWIDLMRLRISRGWSRKETASRLGISCTLISQIETGQNAVSAASMSAIMRVFGVKYEDFFKSAPKMAI